MGREPLTLISDVGRQLVQAKQGFVVNRGSHRIELVVGALDYNRDRALARATSEYYERRLSLYRGQHLFYSTAQKIEASGLPILHPVPDSAELLPWVLAEIAGGERKSGLAAADLVFNLGVSSPSPGSDGTGLAAHLSREQAEVQAISELVERHSVDQVWTEESPTVIEIVDFLEIIASELGDYLSDEQLECHVMVSTAVAGWPTVLATAQTCEGGLGCGSACTPDPKWAIEKAILEAITALLTAQLSISNDADLRERPSSVFHLVNAYLHPQPVLKHLDDRTSEGASFAIVRLLSTFSLSELPGPVGIVQFESRPRIVLRALAPWSRRKQNISVASLPYPLPPMRLGQARRSLSMKQLHPFG